MQQNIIPHYQNGDKTDPMIVINTTDYNYMRNFKGLISTNPNTCVINNDFPRYYASNETIGDTESTKDIFKGFYGIQEFTQEIGNLKVDRPRTKEETPQQESEPQVDPLLSGDFSQSPGARNSSSPELDETLGIIMNIYLNADFIDDLFKSDEKTIRRFDFFSFLKSLCNGINSCFGGYVDLQPIMQDAKICNIVDRNLQARIGRDGKPLNSTDQSPEIKIYGIDYDKQQSNFVTDFSFNTKISKDLATMISIGATANNQSKVELSDFFNNLNNGLTDRFAQKIIDGNTEERKKEEDKIKCADTPKKSSNVGYKLKLTNIGGISVILPTVDIETVKDEKELDDNQSLELFRRDYLDQLVSLFGLSSKKGNPSVYFKSADKTVSKTNTLLKQYVSKYLTVVTAVLRKRGVDVASDMIGFIPIDISITLKGIGGVRIYNQLIADVNFLPQDYPSKVEFIVKGVTHQLQGNQWYTTLQAISKPKGSIVNVSLEADDNITSTNEEAEEATGDDELVYFPPIASLNPIIRIDDGGSGIFGASRDGGNRAHAGVDYLTTDNMNLFAPIPGIIQFSRATKNSRLPGYKVIGSGEYKGVTAYVFYADLTIEPGSRVKKGQRVAKSVALQRSRGGDYPENVTNHIHFKLVKGGKILNPEKIKYSLT